MAVTNKQSILRLYSNNSIESNTGRHILCVNHSHKPPKDCSCDITIIDEIISKDLEPVAKEATRRDNILSYYS